MVSRTLYLSLYWRFCILWLLVSPISYISLWTGAQTCTDTALYHPVDISSCFISPACTARQQQQQQQQSSFHRPCASLPGVDRRSHMLHVLWSTVPAVERGLRGASDLRVLSCATDSQTLPKGGILCVWDSVCVCGGGLLSFSTVHPPVAAYWFFCYTKDAGSDVKPQ